MNLRIRQTGGLVWFTPDMRVTYRPRHTLRALARQYHDYGRWRREVSRRHPETLSLRYLAAPVAVAGVGVGVVLAGRRGGRPGSRGWRPSGSRLPSGTRPLNLAASAQSAMRRATAAHRARPPRLPIVYATMHGSWGLGFLRGLTRAPSARATCAADGADRVPSQASPSP